MQQLFDWLRNEKQKQLNIRNDTKVNGIHEAKPDIVYETKRNFTFDETKQNETKFRRFLCFVKQAKFCETIFLFRKKVAKWKPYPQLSMVCMPQAHLFRFVSACWTVLHQLGLTGVMLGLILCTCT
jgi:hypothetical protein